MGNIHGILLKYLTLTLLFLHVLLNIKRGGDIKAFLDISDDIGPYYAWSNEKFYEALVFNNSVNRMTNFRKTWYEQRRWGIQYALDALKLSTNTSDQQLYTNIMNEVDMITSPKSPLESEQIEWKPVDIQQTFTVKSTYNNKEYSIKFDPKTGAISQLLNTEYNIPYASTENLIGEFIYQTMTGQDFNNFMNEYAILLPPPWWMQGLFSMHF